MSNEKQYLTKEKFDELRKELDFLRTTKRKEVAENLEYAKKLGDLSENTEYHEARERQAETEDRIQHLENILKTAITLDSSGSDVISIGSFVKVQRDSEGEARKYQIVGSEEADMSSSKLSNLCPLGAALMGKKKGDQISFKTPKGTMANYRVIDIE